MFNISRYEEKKTKQFQYSVTNITDRDAGHALKVERMIEKEERERENEWQGSEGAEMIARSPSSPMQA